VPSDSLAWPALTLRAAYASSGLRRPYVHVAFVAGDTSLTAATRPGRRL